MNLSDKIVIGDCTLYLGDCLSILPTLEAGSVDAVVTDPPYGIGKNNIVPGTRTERNSHGRDASGDNFDWDEERKPLELSIALEMVKKAVVCGGNYYSDILPIMRGWVVWDKVNSGNFSECELIWTSQDKAMRIFRYMWNGMIKQKPEERYHPTQKPLALMLWILENYTNPGDTILDPFMGSGTTLVACVQTGRKGIGIEIDPTYFAIAEKRIKEAQLQMRMPI